MTLDCLDAGSYKEFEKLLQRDSDIQTFVEDENTFIYSNLQYLNESQLSDLNLISRIIKNLHKKYSSLLQLATLIESLGTENKLDQLREELNQKLREYTKEEKLIMESLFRFILQKSYNDISIKIELPSEESVSELQVEEVNG